MSFQAVLEEIVAACNDCLGAVLMGSDGIPIAEVATERVPEGPLEEEIGTVGVEFTRILDEIRKASDAIAGGTLSEATIVLDAFSIVFRAIDRETFMAVVVAPDGNLGKARYLMRRHQLSIREEL